jgi:hypothetical protein
MIDWRGTPIVKDAIIVYPGRSGSNQWMVEARVIGEEERDHWGVPQMVLRVQPLRQGTGRVNMSPVVLTALERVTVIDSPTRIKAVV